MKNREVIYVVTYLDDRNQKHLITVKGFSAVRFLEERYGRVFYEVTENYVREEQGKRKVDDLFAVMWLHKTPALSSKVYPGNRNRSFV